MYHKNKGLRDFSPLITVLLLNGIWYHVLMLIFVFDMDGVIYRGTEILPGAVECIGFLRERNARIGFLTNNSTKSREKYVDIFAGHGIKIEFNEVMTSGEATARHLVANGHNGDRIYVIGGDGLTETLERYGFTVDTGDQGDPCGFVVIGWTRGFSFYQIVRAQTEILENDAKLIATNTDAVFPAGEGKFLPGAGTMVAAVETATGMKAEVIGKPKIISLKYLLEDLGVDRNAQPESVWVVGDRLNTDIACGNAYGAKTVLVTTGISTREQAENAPAEMRPDHVIDSLTELPLLL